MKQAIAVAILSASLAQASEPGKWRKVYRWSVAALVAGATLDTASSIGRRELNPLLGRGTFGGRQVAVKCSITAGALVLQRYALKGEGHKPAAIANFAGAAALGGVAIRNWRTK